MPRGRAKDQGRRGWQRDARQRLDERRAREARPIPRSRTARLVRAFLDLVADDESSPLRGRGPDDVTSTKGGIHVVDAPSIGETYVDMLARHGLPEITADGERDPGADGASPPPYGSLAI
jgi:hypothetical protein